MESKSDDFSCGKCKKPYNTTNREPLMLPCGHTFCSQCIQALSAKKFLICPEDPSHTTDISYQKLPKNYSLLNLMWKSSSKEECFEHKKPLDYICVEDKTKTCADCALFGIHKFHDIRPIQASTSEIAIKAVYLIGMSEQINHGISEYFNENNKQRMDVIYEEFQKKKRNQEKEIREGFQKLRKKLIETEKQALKLMQRNFEFIEYHLVAARDIPKLIDSQASIWKEKVDIKLKNIINHAGDPNYIPIDLLEQECTDLLEMGNMIIQDMDGLKDINFDFVENIIHQIDVEFKEELLYKICDISPNINKLGAETERRTYNPNDTSLNISRDISFDYSNVNNDKVFQFHFN